MKIAFDALPLLGKKTGIGYCEAGQIRAMMKLHPENQYQLNYFALKQIQEKKAEISTYLDRHVTAKHVYGSPYVYRMLTQFMPVPYDLFFGGNDQITHFFNYIIPPGVRGKKIVTVHDMVYKSFPDTVRPRTRHMLEMGLFRSMERADRIITDSVFSKSEIIRYYPIMTEKIRVVPCGVDTEKFHPCPERIGSIREKYQIDSDYFLYLGTLDPRKNLKNLIQAYALYCQDHGDPPLLVLAGAKSFDISEITQLCKNFHLEKSILFLAYIADEDVCPLMSGAIAFLFPSLYEGFGMPPLEAMACGAPVIVSDQASLPEVVGDCALISKTDAVSLSHAMHEITADATLRKELCQKGLKRAEAFSWERSAEQLYAVYQELVPEG